jgi:hypothetical protein
VPDPTEIHIGGVYCKKSLLLATNPSPRAGTSVELFPFLQANRFMLVIGLPDHPAM